MMDIYETKKKSSETGIILMDWKDIGWSNLGIDFSMKVTTLIWQHYVDCTKYIYLVNTNWGVKVILTAVNPILPQKI